MKYELKMYLDDGSTLTIVPKKCDGLLYTFTCCGKTVAIREGHEDEDCRSLGVHRCQEAA